MCKEQEAKEREVEVEVARQIAIEREVLLFGCACATVPKLLLNVVAWIFAFYVSFFSAANAARQKARSKLRSLRRNSSAEIPAEDDEDAWKRRWREALEGKGAEAPPEGEEEEAELAVLDRIDMIFCLQGFETALVQEFLLDALHKAVRVERLHRRSVGLCYSALRCLRQLLRMMELHVCARNADVREAVLHQLERWVGSGVVADLAFVTRRFKPRAMNPRLFLAAVECAAVILSLMKALGGSLTASQEGFKARRAKRGAEGGSGAAALWEDEEGVAAPSATRQVVVDDVRSDFFKGEVVSNCIYFVRLRACTQDASDSLTEKDGKRKKQRDTGAVDASVGGFQRLKKIVCLLRIAVYSDQSLQVKPAFR